MKSWDKLKDGIIVPTLKLEKKLCDKFQRVNAE